jgi:Xaa-Pro aminopeptidase
MILSNEPGFYKEGEYGIRIENLMLVEKCDDNFLQFRTLSLAPLDPNLINFAMLTYPERKWLKEYHELVLKTFEHCLEAEEKTWLQNLTRKFKSAS